MRDRLCKPNLLWQSVPKSMGSENKRPATSGFQPWFSVCVLAYRGIKDQKYRKYNKWERVRGGVFCVLLYVFIYVSTLLFGIIWIFIFGGGKKIIDYYCK